MSKATKPTNKVKKKPSKPVGKGTKKPPTKKY